MSTDEPTYPVQRCIPSRCAEPQHQQSRIPESIARAGFVGYEGRWGSGQTFERLHERGGFSWGELVIFEVEGVKPCLPTR